MPISSYRLHSPHRFNTTHGETEFNVSLLSGNLEEWKEWEAVNVWEKLLSKASLDVTVQDLQQFISGDKKIERTQTLMRAIKALAIGLSDHPIDIQYQEWRQWVERYQVPMQWQRWAYPFMSAGLFLHIHASDTDKDIPWFSPVSSVFPNWRFSEPDTLWEKLMWEVVGHYRHIKSSSLSQMSATHLTTLLQMPTESTVANALSMKTFVMLWDVFLHDYVENHLSSTSSSPLLSSLSQWWQRFQPSVSPTLTHAWHHAFDLASSRFTRSAYSTEATQIALNGLGSVLAQSLTVDSPSAWTFFIRNAESAHPASLSDFIALNPFSIRITDPSTYNTAEQTLWKQGNHTTHWPFVLIALEKAWLSLSLQEQETVRAQPHWKAWVEQAVKTWSVSSFKPASSDADMKRAAQDPEHVHRWLTLFADWMQLPSLDVLSHVLHKVSASETFMEYQKTHLANFAVSDLNWTWTQALVNQNKEHDRRLRQTVHQSVPKSPACSLWDTLSPDAVLSHNQRSLWQFSLRIPLFENVAQNPMLLGQPTSSVLSDLLGPLGASVWYQEDKRLRTTLSSLPKEEQNSCIALHTQRTLNTFNDLHDALPADLRHRWWPMMFAQGVCAWLHSESADRPPWMVMVPDLLQAWRTTLDSSSAGLVQDVVRSLMEHYWTHSKNGSNALYGSFLPDLSTVLTDMTVFRDLFRVANLSPEEVPEFPVLLTQALSLVSNVNLTHVDLALLLERLDGYAEEHPLWKQHFQAWTLSSPQMRSSQLQHLLNARVEKEVLTKTLPVSERFRSRSPRL